MKEKRTSEEEKKSEVMETPALSRVDEEDAVAALHARAEAPDLTTQPKFAHIEALGSFTKNLTRLEFYPLYERYQKGEVATLGDIEKTAKRVGREVERLRNEEGLSNEYMSEELRIARLLEGRVRSIRQGVNRYVQTVIRFHNVKRAIRLRPEKEVELMQEADGARKIAHDGLIESLRVYATAVRSAVAADLIEDAKIAVWDPAHPINRARKEDARLLTFSPAFLDDRDLMRNWAMTVDYNEKMEVIEKALSESKT